MARRLALLALAPLLSCSEPAPPPSPAARAVRYLMAQAEDGLWKSKTTTVLGSGQALTPFVLWALSHAPPEERAPHRAAIERALDRLPLRGSEHPTYALALSILALQRLRPSQDLAGLRGELRSLQLAEPLGWTEGDPEYGGWDVGVVPARKPRCQNPNISITAFAAEALGGDAKARRFAERCRAPGGGFLFTPSEAWAHQNKGGPKAGYASATCDALRILGSPEGGLPALPPLPPDGEEALFYYRAFARARVAPTRELAEAVRARQRPDGSWKSDAGLMKEDDPLVATGLALVALNPSR